MPKLSSVKHRVFSRLLSEKVPSIFLPDELKVLVQMRRGSSTSFSSTLSISYAIEKEINYSFDEGLELDISDQIIRPLDARSLEFSSKKVVIHTSHFSSVLSNHKFERAYVRLRDPFKQFFSYYTYLTLYHTYAADAASQALQYLQTFVKHLEGSNSESVKIVCAEDYFSSKFDQLNDFFQFVKLDVSTDSIKQAVSQYEEVEVNRKNFSNFSPRKSYADFYLPIETEVEKNLRSTITNSIFNDYYKFN